MLFPPKWVKGLPDTVDRTSELGNVLFDGTVEHLKENGINIMNTKPNLEIMDSIKAWLNIKFLYQVQDKNYLPAKQYQEFEYIYLRALFEGEDFTSAVERFAPYRERYVKNINLFESDLSTYITGSSDITKNQLVQSVTNITKNTVYLFAATLFKDKKSEIAYRELLNYHL